MKLKYIVKTQAIGEQTKVRYEGYSILEANRIKDGYNETNKEKHGENFAWIEEIKQ